MKRDILKRVFYTTRRKANFSMRIREGQAAQEAMSALATLFWIAATSE